MKIEKFEQLQQEMEEGTYEKNYASIERTLYFSSFLGNLASVVFAFFFVNMITGTIENFIPGQGVIFPILIIIFLSAYELLKRFVFRRLVVNFLIGRKKIAVKTVAGLAFTAMLIFGSFYLSLNGAQEVVDNTEKIQYNIDSVYVAEKKSLETFYDTEVEEIKDKIDFAFNNARNRGDGGLGPRETKNVARWEQDIKDLRAKEAKELKQLKDKLYKENERSFDKIKENKTAFIVLSTLIELLILIGVGFNAYYWFYSYKEFKNKVSRSPNYKKYKAYKYLLVVLYQNGNKQIGDELPTTNQFIQLVNEHDIEVTRKDIMNFLSVIQQLGVVRVKSNRRRVSIVYEDAQDKIRDYFVIT